MSLSVSSVDSTGSHRGAGQSCCCSAPAIGHRQHHSTGSAVSIAVERGLHVRWLIFRRRPRLEEDNASLNAHFIDQFAKLPGFRRSDGIDVQPPFTLYEGRGSLELRLARKVLVEGLGGQVRYCARFPGWINQDIAMCDDTLMFKLNTEKFDYADFCRITLPDLIGVFGPYRVRVQTDEMVEAADWEITRVQFNETGRNVDGRDSVYRIWPVCYFDEILCQRAFGIGAAEVVARAVPECERAELLHGGAFLIVTTEVVTGFDLDVLNARIVRSLGASSAVSKGAA